MLTSYHNHTRWSDGHGTLAEMIEGARAAGLDEVGISDHYVFLPGEPWVDWTMDLGFLDEYVRTIDAARREQTAAPALRLGLEADYVPETIHQLATRLEPYPFDYLIGSVHYVDGFLVDEEASRWEPLSVDQRNDVWRGYWQRIAELAQSRVFDFVGHLDLPKIFGYRATVDLTAEENRALDAIAAADMAIEINTAGWKKPVGEQYPAEHLLQGARRRGIPLVINADAHGPGNLADYLDRGRALAAACGYTELVRYERRRRHAYPL